MGHPLAAHFRILGHGNPFALDEERIGAVKTLGDADLAVIGLTLLSGITSQLGSTADVETRNNFV